LKKLKAMFFGDEKTQESNHDEIEEDQNLQENQNEKNKENLNEIEVEKNNNNDSDNNDSKNDQNQEKIQEKIKENLFTFFPEPFQNEINNLRMQHKITITIIITLKSNLLTLGVSFST
jgi:hypothetical protein